MTQAKKGFKPKQNTLQKRFLSLSPREQQGVTVFFNAHNAAHYVYEGLSEEAQAYVSYCIKLSQNADHVEKVNENKNSAQES